MFKVHGLKGLSSAHLQQISHVYLNQGHIGNHRLLTPSPGIFCIRVDYDSRDPWYGIRTFIVLIFLI